MFSSARFPILLLLVPLTCADLSRGATEDDILGVAAIMGLQAIEYRRLYPGTDLPSA